MRRRPVLHAAAFFMLLTCGRVAAQEITVEPVGKAPPAGIPGGGIQVNVHNRTTETQHLRIRKPGSNWLLLEFPPRAGRNLRCASCSGPLQGALRDDAANLLQLSPGTEYEIRREADGAVRVRPAGR